MTKRIARICSVSCIIAAGCTSSNGSPALTPTSPHPYDFVPDPNSEYVRNDKVSLAREYWIVYRAPDDTYSMFPRPDGAPALQRACAAAGEWAAMLADARLCHPASSAEDVARVNALSRDEALELSTYLHQQLHFEPVDGDTQPHALLSDIIDVCRTFAEARAGELRAVCDRELAWVSEGPRPDIAVQLSSPEAAALAQRLNQLYGIER